MNNAEVVEEVAPSLLGMACVVHVVWVRCARGGKTRNECETGS